MSAPDRPSREQVNAVPHKAAALLLAAARVDPTLRAAAEQVQDALIALDAELVDALDVAERLRAQRDKLHQDADRVATELTARADGPALAARTPQPAGDSAVHAEARRVIREAWGALPESVAYFARTEGATLAACIRAIPAPPPAVPDREGEDRPVRWAWAAWLAESAAQAGDLTEREAQGMRIAATHLLDDDIAVRVARIEGLDHEWLTAFTEGLHARIEAHRFAVRTVRAAATSGEDVPARLDAAADALAADRQDTGAGMLRDVAHLLRRDPDLCAAVAAALARPVLARDEPSECGGCESPLCEDCRGPIGGAR